jgi:glycosyltransferase involved in cell wall biosynthesis
MIIGIDGNEANISYKVGVNQYAYELIWEFYRMKKSGKTKDSFIIFLKNEKKPDLPDEIDGFRYQMIPGKILWQFFSLTPRLIIGKKVDVFFSPSHYLPLSLAVPMVCTIHDLGYLKFSGQFKKPDFWQLKYWSAISIYISKYIIAVSESTKKDIVRHYKTALKKVDVIHHGYDKNSYNLKIPKDVVRRVKNQYKTSENYILFLGTLKPSKNIEGLIEAFAGMSGDFRDTSLVIAGKKGWLYNDIFQKVKKLKLEKKVILTGYINESDKPALIRGAKVFVIPSFWEGFGMDVLNALACGTPVVAGKVASLPEVGGEAVFYVNPEKPEEMRKSIEQVLTMSDLEYNKLIMKAKKHLQKFSWKKTAQKTLKVLERANK